MNCGERLSRRLPAPGRASPKTPSGTGGGTGCAGDAASAVETSAARAAGSPAETTSAAESSQKSRLRRNAGRENLIAIGRMSLTSALAERRASLDQKNKKTAARKRALRCGDFRNSGVAAGPAIGRGTSLLTLRQSLSTIGAKRGYNDFLCEMREMQNYRPNALEAGLLKGRASCRRSKQAESGETAGVLWRLSVQGGWTPGEIFSRVAKGCMEHMCSSRSP